MSTPRTRAWGNSRARNRVPIPVPQPTSRTRSGRGFTSSTAVASAARNSGEKLSAVVKTSCGTFDIALDAQRAPKTVNSFVYLARKGFYDGLDFFRVTPNFVIQGGDPLGNGLGGPGYHVDEQPPRNLAY